jgi:transposase
MAVKLEKMKLASEAEIKALPHHELIGLTLSLIERMGYYQGIIYRSNKKIFGSSSERTLKTDLVDTTTVSATSSGAENTSKSPNPRNDTTKKLSNRYPDTGIEEDIIGFANTPCCPACNAVMQDSEMTEDSEYLTTKPKEYIIVRQKRQKYRCHKCHSSIATAPAPDRVTPGGSYSDELIIDATLSKYCDLIPMERYCQMAARRGILGLPPHSLIVASMKLGSFLNIVYQRIKQETLNTKVLLADETPHRMLEGDAKKSWYLWGFSSLTSSFFECHNTRSGDISTTVLMDSVCEYLLTDVYSGYGKSIRLANEIRTQKSLPIIYAAYCNAHARRQFKDRDSNEVTEDAESMIKQYQEIYRLNAEGKNQSPEVILQKRSQMRPIFEAMKEEALQKINSYSSKSQMFTAYNYFIKNYDGLTIFLTNYLIPIDNNQSERLLRSHVIGRKTWYGTHSQRAAQTAAIHFTIVESCKLIGVNPRDFYQDAVQRIHRKLEPLTPLEYKKLRDSNTC